MTMIQRREFFKQATAAAGLAVLPTGATGELTDAEITRRMSAYSQCYRIFVEERDICRRFGRRLGNAMIRTGAKPSELAKAAGLSTVELVDVLGGNLVDLDLVTADALSDAVGCELRHLLDKGASPWD